MKQQELLYVHGGERAVGKVGELAKALQSSVTDFIPQFKKFESFWNSLDLNGKPAEARAALRRFMGLDRYTKDSKPIELGRSELERLRITTLEILSGAQLITVPEQAAVEELRGMRDEINTVDGFKEWWSKPSSARIRALLDLVWSGTGPSIYRRAYDAVRKEIPPELSAYAIELKANILKFTPPSFPNQLLPGFPTPSYLGMDEAVDILTDMWANLPGLDELRARFGAALTPDVYRTLLAQHDVLISVLREYFVSDRFKSELFNHGFDALRTAIITRWDHSSVPELVALHKKYGDWKDDFFKRTLDASERLKLFEAVVTDVINFYSKLRFDPPEYLFFSSRVQMSVSDKVKEFVERLWSQKFRLASLGDKNFWSFLLDSESSIIVKLNGTRSVDDIVREVDNAYSTDVKSNPLGLPGELSDKSKGLNDFLDRLDPAIRSVQWRGVLIIRPTADISNDTQLANLTGISDFPMVYAAIGGSKPELTGESLDVYANIYRERMPLNVEGTPPEDLTFTLIKFDATIRNTRLVAGEVIFRFDIRNVFGRDTTDNTKFPVLMLRGALPRDKKADANSFEFSGWFEKPIRYPAQDPENKGLIAFIRAVVFKTLRVSTNRGQTAVDIDAELLLKPWDVELAGQSFHVGPDTGKDATLNLQNFRILLPSLPSGASIPFGLPRLLNFELPAIAFNWPSPRPLNLWDGIELLPIGMGFIRRVAEAKDAFQRFRDRYRWIGEIQPPEGIFQLPYLRCSIHFGKLPFLGGTNLSRLNLELVIAAVIEAPGKSPTIRIGIGDIDGRDISIDLFGLIKLEIEKMILARFTTSDSKQAVTLSVKNPRLTICGWSPLAKSDQFQFLLANAEGRTDGRAALGFYTHDPGENGFFRLYWLLIAHNLKLKNELIGQYLMSDAKPEDAHHLLDHFVDTEKKEIQAQILEDDSWLLGASFALGKIVERGTLIMHDQHYYGIALRGEPIKKMFGVNRLELAYICGQTRAQDRFRACFRLAALDFIGSLRSGDIAIEWGFNWDFLLDFGFPWKSGAAYLWERAFSLPMGSYEVKFGLYCEKRTQMTPSGAKELTLSAGVGFYFGYYIGFGTPGRFVWAQAGIGVFAILEGSIRFELPAGGGGANLIKGTIREVMVRGVIGIFAYGEGGIEIWVISARFRVSVQAAIAGEFHYLPGASSCLRYAATLYAGYSASCRVGSGWFSFTFEVSGSIEMQISGQALLN